MITKLYSSLSNILYLNIQVDGMRLHSALYILDVDSPTSVSCSPTTTLPQTITYKTLNLRR